MLPVDLLSRMLRPAGGGVHLVSTGREAQRALQRRLYGVEGEAEVEARWRAELARAAGARAVLLAIPSDVGGGLQRGANLGPAALRARLLDDHPERLARARAAGLVDLGDVFSVPQLLEDEMLSAGQLASSRRALYPDLADEARRRAAGLAALDRRAGPLAGAGRQPPGQGAGARAATTPPPCRWCGRWPGCGPGSGSCRWTPTPTCWPERLGVRHCFGTWSYHANELLGRGGRLVQVGIRASGRDQRHWEETLDVRQHWAEEVRRDPEGAVERIVAQLRAAGVSTAYLSNDIDGTDAAFADATGTPEPGGLDPETVSLLVRRLGAEPGLCGGDVMEVAPQVAGSPGGRERDAGHRGPLPDRDHRGGAGDACDRSAQVRRGRIPARGALC